MYLDTSKNRMATGISFDENEQDTNNNNNTECAICLEQPGEPKWLPCQHIFCLACLERLVIRRADGSYEIKCPTCRTVHHLPTGVDDLPGTGDNFTCSDLKQYCTICRVDPTTTRPPAVEYCFTCKALHCRLCSAKHSCRSSTQLSEKHVTVKLNQRTLTALLCKSCDDGCEDIVVYFCQNCKQPVCNVCSLYKHNGHKFTTFKIKDIEDVRSICEVNQSVDNNTDRISRQQQWITTTRTNNDDHQRETKETIISLYEEKLNILQQNKERLCNDADSFHSAVIATLNQFQADIENVLRRTNEERRTLQALTTPFDQLEHLIPDDRLSIEAVKNRIKSLPVALSPSITFGQRDFNSELERPLQPLPDRNLQEEPGLNVHQDWQDLTIRLTMKDAYLLLCIGLLIIAVIAASVRNECIDVNQVEQICRQHCWFCS